MIILDGPQSSSDAGAFLTGVAYLLWCIMMPRFFLSVRELYDRDSRGRCQGTDTGSDVFSQHTTSENGVVSMIAFAPGQQETMSMEGRLAEDLEAIQLVDVVEDGVHRVHWV